MNKPYWERESSQYSCNCDHCTQFIEQGTLCDFCAERCVMWITDGDGTHDQIWRPATDRLFAHAALQQHLRAQEYDRHVRQRVLTLGSEWVLRQLDPRVILATRNAVQAIRELVTLWRRG